MENTEAKHCAPADDVLRALLGGARRITIIGAKDVPGQPVDRVGRYLAEAGYELTPVHPKRRTVWDIPAVPSVTEVPAADIVVLFRASQFCADHAREVLAMKTRPACFWMQEGIFSAEARRLLEPEGVLVVEDRCIMVEHRRLAVGKAAG
ncbi:MAG: CoA-binding protein [Desulfovibrionaceae bacterium]|nr:CoA-binding protein [Desulfovibrionaceae bacterium]